MSNSSNPPNISNAKNAFPLTATSGVEVSTQQTGTLNTGIPYVTTYYTTNITGDPSGASPIIINEYTALTIPAFYSGARFLAETLAGLHRGVYQRDAINRNEKIEQFDSPISYLLNDECNELQTPFTTMSTFFFHAVVWSNAYLLIDRDSGGNPIGLYNLLPDRVVAFRHNGQQWYAVNVTYGNDQKYQVIAAADIIHLPALSYNGMTGLPMVWLMRQALRLGKSAETFGGKFFDQGANLGGSIKVPSTITKEQLADIRKSIDEQKTGVQNSHKWMVTVGDVEPFDIEMDKAQFLETRTFSILDICRALRIPPHLVYELGKATWANLDQLEREVVKYSLTSWIMPTEQEFQRKLFSTDERRNQRLMVHFDIRSLLRGDPVVQTQNAVALVNAGITDADEQRAGMGLPPFPDGKGKVVRMPSGSVPVASENEIVPTATPAPEAPSTATPNAIKFADILPLIADIANRVQTKTAKAIENKGKGITVAWSNVFAETQGKYAAESTQPALETFGRLIGRSIAPDAANGIGERYTTALRGYFAALGREETAVAPDLASIITEMGEKL